MHRRRRRSAHALRRDRGAARGLDLGQRSAGRNRGIVGPGGGGTCVGRKFPGIEWKVIRIVDGPIASLADADELPHGEIGELIVRGRS